MVENRHSIVFSWATGALIVSIMVFLLFGNNSLTGKIIASESNDKGSVSVIVFDSANSKIVSNAVVFLMNGNEKIAVKKTPSNGEASFSGVESGRYFVFVQADGFVKAKSNVFVVSRGKHTIASVWLKAN